jgi:phenylalanyl-tRNA synthetase beta chain
MRVPLSWLSEYVDVELSPEALAERLTLLGMEVQKIERWGGDWENVVVGELLAVERHPRADRLSLTKVTVGTGEPLEIVCGATNIAPGQRVPVALPGAVLPGGRRIERTEKMGAVSNGMLCSGEELNLTSDGDGILILGDDAPLGAPLVELYGDWVLDVDVKPNRGDALSIVGLAREVSAVTGSPIRFPETDPPEADGDVADRLVVSVEEPDLCPRFVGRWIGGVRMAPSPDRVQSRLLAAGMRPVSNVVDASNYVMLELGKPIHTYDAYAVRRAADGRHTIVVRRGRAGERLEAIDHVSRELDADTLVIADPSGPIGIAGVIGSAESEVGDDTTDVIVESAIFDPVAIRRTGQRLGLRSEASLRFEKGQEYRLARLGADRTTRLIAEWAGGTVARGRVDTAPEEPTEGRVAFRPARVNRLLNTELTADEQRELLGRVGIRTEPGEPRTPILVAAGTMPLTADAGGDETVVAVVPTWRRDLVIEADVAEEVARVAGYETIASVTPDTAMPDYRPSPLQLRDVIRQTLAGAGLTEVVSHALVSPQHLELFRFREPVTSVGDDPQPVAIPVTVTNPLSREHSILRQGVVGSLVEIIRTNARHGRHDVAAFEVGTGYGAAGEGKTVEWWRLAIALVGAAEPPAWNRVRRDYDVDDAKGLVELICRRLGLAEPVYRADGSEPLLHPGRTARVSSGLDLDGIVGELHPEVAQTLDLTGRIVVAELAVVGLSGGQLRAVRSNPPPRFPAVERDLAVIVRDDQPAAAVREAIQRHAGELLRSVSLFDVYRGSPLGPGEKSLAHRLVFQAPDRTLTDAEIDEAMAAIERGVGADVGGRLRS